MTKEKPKYPYCNKYQCSTFDSRFNNKTCEEARIDKNGLPCCFIQGVFHCKYLIDTPVAITKDGFLKLVEK